jgi:hypothetical protein
MRFRIREDSQCASCRALAKSSAKSDDSVSTIRDTMAIGVGWVSSKRRSLSFCSPVSLRGSPSFRNFNRSDCSFGLSPRSISNWTSASAARSCYFPSSVLAAVRSLSKGTEFFFLAAIDDAAGDEDASASRKRQKQKDYSKPIDYRDEVFEDPFNCLLLVLGVLSLGCVFVFPFLCRKCCNTKSTAGDHFPYYNNCMANALSTVKEHGEAN